MMLVSSPFPPSFPATSLIPRRHCRRIPAILNSGRSVLAAFSASTSDDVDAFTKYSGYLFELSTSEAESLTEYKITRISAIYKKKPFVLLRRLFQIGTTFGKWFALRYYDSLTERSDLMFEVRINISLFHLRLLCYGFIFYSFIIRNSNCKFLFDIIFQIVEY